MPQKWPRALSSPSTRASLIEMLSTKPNSDQIIRTEGSIAVVRETDKHGDDTGAAYYHCQECGGECMTSWPKANAHRDGCPEGER